MSIYNWWVRGNGMHRLLFVLLLPFVVVTANAKPFTVVAVMQGIATVKDGDGVILNGTEIRLQGIAAPEDNEFKREPGGPEATENLRKLVEGKHLRCDLDGTRTRGRPVGVCYLGNLDIGEHLVRTGHARDCPRYSGGRHGGAERAARLAGANLSAIYPLPRYCHGK